jgi:hypothetical protein
LIRISPARNTPNIGLTFFDQTSDTVDNGTFAPQWAEYATQIPDVVGVPPFTIQIVNKLDRKPSAIIVKVAARRSRKAKAFGHQSDKRAKYVMLRRLGRHTTCRSGIGHL